MRSRPRSVPALALGGLLALTACGGTTSSAGGAAAEREERLEVLAALYPYQWVAEQVGGDDVVVRNLTPPGAEPHDLELSPQQVAELGEADLVLYSAGFQPAVDEAVASQGGDAAFDVLTAVDVRSYEEGDAHAEEDGEEHSEEGAAHGEEGHEDHEGEDPHVWLDPTRLATVADAVADRLAQRDPENAEAFRSRAASVTADLEELDADLKAGLSSCPRSELVTSHDAFGYLADRYGLEQVAVSGLSPEDEPSPRRLAEVAEFAREHGVTTIFFEELVSPRVAESLAREVGARAEVLSPLEGPPDEGGYLEAMRTNLETMRTALGCA